MPPAGRTSCWAIASEGGVHQAVHDDRRVAIALVGPLGAGRLHSWHSSRPAAAGLTAAAARLRERRSAVSLSPAMALVPRLRLGIGGAPTASLFRPVQDATDDRERF
jgi:hypothetical protein